MNRILKKFSLQEFDRSHSHGERAGGRFICHTLYDYHTHVNSAIKVENRSQHALITSLM